MRLRLYYLGRTNALCSCAFSTSATEGTERDPVQRSH